MRSLGNFTTFASLNLGTLSGCPLVLLTIHTELIKWWYEPIYALIHKGPRERVEAIEGLKFIVEIVHRPQGTPVPAPPRTVAKPKAVPLPHSQEAAAVRAIATKEVFLLRKGRTLGTQIL